MGTPAGLDGIRLEKHGKDVFPKNATLDTRVKGAFTLESIAQVETTQT